jgi:hypothetical protein
MKLDIFKKKIITFICIILLSTDIITSRRLKKFKLTPEEEQRIINEKKHELEATKKTISDKWKDATLKIISENRAKNKNQYDILLQDLKRFDAVTRKEVMDEKQKEERKKLESERKKLEEAAKKIEADKKKEQDEYNQLNIFSKAFRKAKNAAGVLSESIFGSEEEEHDNEEGENIKKLNETGNRLKRKQEKLSIISPTLKLNFFHEILKSNPRLSQPQIFAIAFYIGIQSRSYFKIYKRIIILQGINKFIEISSTSAHFKVLNNKYKLLIYRMLYTIEMEKGWKFGQKNEIYLQQSVFTFIKKFKNEFMKDELPLFEAANCDCETKELLNGDEKQVTQNELKNQVPANNLNQGSKDAIMRLFNLERKRSGFTWQELSENFNSVILKGREYLNYFEEVDKRFIELKSIKNILKIYYDLKNLDNLDQTDKVNEILPTILATILNLQRCAIKFDNLINLRKEIFSKNIIMEFSHDGHHFVDYYPITKEELEQDKKLYSEICPINMEKSLLDSEIKNIAELFLISGNLISNENTGLPIPKEQLHSVIEPSMLEANKQLKNLDNNFILSHSFISQLLRGYKINPYAVQFIVNSGQNIEQFIQLIDKIMKTQQKSERIYDNYISSSKNKSEDWSIGWWHSS